ncbi:DUF4136 domain-containing protein [Variovorax terrae]|uniref:DUF4136 domain-containing protein n=1 Tax=Variovorax terrae TaxID=2923278 RepID=A0A9X2ALM6_9BURK|nr:DUF4136 domain-containing protein [Variovorax terrae]MCJ0761825.1 DUF4136 domain-containing protein [Variovorax terrae]
MGALLFIAFLLSGCASTLLVDSDVSSFSTLKALPGPAHAAYRFERLPSQQRPGASQDQLEAMAQQALAKVGLRRDDAAPSYSIQIDARVQRMLPPWAGPGDGWGRGGPYGYGYWGRGAYLAPYPRFPESPWYQREVSLVMRDLASNLVVYETRAAHDGPWPDSASILPVMFDAALQGFPTPPTGLRRVDIEIPR